MRTLIGITATVLALAGCGGHAQRDARVHDDTPASYDALASDRTRDRDADVAASTTPPDVSVQQAYDRFRAERRARGEIGTAGETARAHAGTPPPPTAGPNTSAVGGTSAGGQAGDRDRVAGTDQLGGTSSAGAPTTTTDPIPYAGSRTISPPYPGLVLAPDKPGAAPTGGTGDRGGTRLRTITPPTDPSANQWLGQPPGDSGPNRLDAPPRGGNGSANR